MSLHDEYARLTPVELAFGDRDRMTSFADEVDREVGGRGGDASDPNRFILLGAVSRTVRGIQREGADPSAVHSYGALAYQSYHFLRADCPLYLLTTRAARYLVDGPPDGPPEAPKEAGYLQLPQHLFWLGHGSEGTPESVDGVFWVRTPAGVLHTLLATGLRPDRVGLSVVPMPDAPAADAADWMSASVREGGSDFSSALPGAELDALYAVESAGEVLKLLARFFAYIASVPKAAVRREAALSSTPTTGGPKPSVLPFTRVDLHG
jgi:hypothetical protein